MHLKGQGAGFGMKGFEIVVEGVRFGALGSGIGVVMPGGLRLKAWVSV